MGANQDGLAGALWKLQHRVSAVQSLGQKGVWERLFQILSKDADWEWLLLDSTVVRTHQHAAGKKGGNRASCWGRSQGGFSTKIHVATDALGNPGRLRLTPGQAADISQGPAQIEDIDFEAAIANQAFDDEKFIQLIAQHHTVEGRPAEAVISPKKSQRSAVL